MSKAATDIASYSYTPYSNSTEFCHVLGESGVWYPGVRIENISFPLTITAVQAAICSCLGNGDHPIGLSSNKPQKVLRFWIETFDLQEMETLPKNAGIYNPLKKDMADVKQSLKELSESSISSQSNFPVAAILKTNDGFIEGVNVEFEQWNLGLCAERVALSRAIAAGYTHFFGMHIYAPKSEYIAPCGACRQVLFELMPNQVLELHHDDQSLSRHLVSHLLPNSFITSSLKK